MAARRLEFSVDEHTARRMVARAADLHLDLASVARQELSTWLGEWGLDCTDYTVRAGDTLSSIAERFYRDRSKAAVIAAYNDLGDASLIQVGQVLSLPEVRALPPLPEGESPYIFGLHDRGGEHLMAEAGHKGWVLCTEKLGADPDNWTSASYADLVEAGYGVLVRLNHGYGESGTLPHSKHYADFAQRCGNFVERSRGCHIWIIANEPNLAVERPGGPEHGEWITPERYVAAFEACRREIRGRPGHTDDQVVVAAIGPWNVQTPYPGNPSGDWITTFRDILIGLEGGLDGIALHTYARDSVPGNIVSEARMDPPFEHRRSMFRTYIDFMEAVPPALRHLPVYLTEANQNTPWNDIDNGWVQAAYAEIERWNNSSARQKIRCMLLYRWQRADVWHIEGKSRIIRDFRLALQHDYRWRKG